MISIFLLVIFIIVSLTIILLVLLQNEEGETLGGVFGGSSQSVFGSQSPSVLLKIMFGMCLLFFILAFLLAWLNKTPVHDKAILQLLNSKNKKEHVEKQWWKSTADENSHSKNVISPKKIKK